MKRSLSLMLVGAALTLALRLPADVMVLELQKSSDLKTWESVPVDPASLGASGTILQNGNNSGAYYRLRIRSDADAGFLTAIPLEQASAEAIDIARQFLLDFPQTDPKAESGDPEGTWQNVMLGPVCYPVYDPAVNKGQTPAYLQFKVVSRALPAVDAKGEDGMQLGAPDATDDHGDFGSILVSLTRGDFPVAEFSDRGPTSVEMLLRRSRAKGPIKAVRFDDGFLAAEDESGQMVGSLGNAPFHVDPEVLTIAGQPFEGEADDVEGERSNQSPEFPAKEYRSYSELKEDAVGNPLFQELRRLRAEQAQLSWDLRSGIEPESILIGLKQPTLVLPNDRLKSASAADPSIALAEVDKSGVGLWLTGLKEGGTVLTVNFADGRQVQFVLAVGSAGQKGANLELATSGWTSWSYSYAGNWGDQRRYNQFANDSLMCSSGWSGCGPTAWSMLYGWWDLHGSPRCLRGLSAADAPLYNDSSVRDCDRYLFPRLGTFCVSGQAATLPWFMKNGYQWGLARGAGFNISWNWGVPYISPWCQDKAKDSIRAGRPSIVGLGFYWHYPLAYGYAQREYKILGITFATDKWYKCNMGWGGSSPQWRNGSSVWFATNGRYW